MRGSRKLWMFRLLAIGLGLLPLAIAELALRATGVGRATESADPYISFASSRQLFERDTAMGQYVTSSARLDYFCPQSFPVAKGAREFRIFCLGGSTVHGRPYAAETSFTTWLQLSLQAADSTRDWRVINCGGISYASYRLIPILEETLEYEPDLYILYTGHNEFLEDRTYAKRPSAGVAWGHRTMSRLRLYNAARSLLGRDRVARSVSELADEVDAVLDYEGGLAEYTRDDAWRTAVTDHYRANLLRMVALTEAAGVPLVLVDPVSNLRDCPPFKTETSIEGVARKTFERLWDQAKSADDPEERIKLLQQAISIDDRHASAHFLLGRSLLDTRATDAALAAFIRAKDEDVCPLRMIEPLHDVLRTVASETGTPLVDARRQFHADSLQGIPGEREMLDHVHPTINGHQRIAELLFERLAELGEDPGQTVMRQDRSWPTVEKLAKLRGAAGTAEWMAVRKELYARHLATLDTPYYARGKQNLAGLKRWTEGRAKKLKRPDNESQ